MLLLLETMVGESVEGVGHLVSEDRTVGLGGMVSLLLDLSLEGNHLLLHDVHGVHT
jgi:hypothetical protein